MRANQFTVPLVIWIRRREAHVALRNDKRVLNREAGLAVLAGGCEAVRRNSERRTMTGFWTEGFVARRKTIQDEFEKRLDELRKKLERASSRDETREIKRAIRDERAAYKLRLAQLNRSLY